MIWPKFAALSKKLSLSFAFTTSILLVGCNTQEISSHWAAQPVKVDGEMTEWKGIPTTYFKESDVQLGLCNDSENLYILFRFSNQLWARAIRMGGITIWMDDSGEKKKHFGLRYAGGSSLSEMQKSGLAGQGGFWESLTSEQRQHLEQREAAMANRITIINKEKNGETTIPANGSRGPAAGSAVLQGIYAYEFRIPLERIRYGIGARPGGTISLGLEWGEVGNRPGRRGGEWGTGRGRGGMGGGLGGRPGGGGLGERPGRRKHSPPPEKQEFWVKTVLALSPTGK